jgi:8-oxo-dGTP pyrophosphatase MutT (NUDIX family)
MRREPHAPSAHRENCPDMPYAFNDSLRARIQQHLARFDVRRIANTELRRAAVALVVVKSETDDTACLLLTRRSDKLRRHSGQFALPGGRLDPGETTVQAALRELDEELGLPLGEDTILGRLDDFETKSGFRMRPVVMWGGVADKLRPDPVEVDKVFRIPFSELDSPAIPLLEPGETLAKPLLSAPLPTMGNRVHAPTAALLYQFREVAMRGIATRVAHFDQPMFARR